jgi:uncharacterized protein (DUF983 family)
VSERTCTYPGCEEPAKARGWCKKHWRRWRKHGDPAIVLLRRVVGTPEERFWANVNKQGPVPEHRPELGPCWLWRGTKSNGYGVFWVPPGRLVLAHRFAYTLLVGPIPEGLEPDHLCRVPACVRPLADAFGLAHLEPVTHAENMARGYWATAPHCKRGHLFDEANTYWTSAGKRQCRQCKSYRRRRDVTHCPQGHLYDAANTYIEARGIRRCRACGRA